MNERLTAYVTALAGKTDREDRTFTSHLLEAMAEDAARELLSALGDPDEKVRYGAV